MLWVSIAILIVWFLTRNRFINVTTEIFYWGTQDDRALQVELRAYRDPDGDDINYWWVQDKKYAKRIHYFIPFGLAVLLGFLVAIAVRLELLSIEVDKIIEWSITIGVSIWLIVSLIVLSWLNRKLILRLKKIESGKLI